VAITSVVATFDVSLDEEMDESMSLLQVKASAVSMVEGGSDATAESNGPGLKKPVQPPLMILQRGCTGSSEIMRMAREMLPLFGVDLYPLSVKELVRASKNPWFQEGEDMGTAMQRGVNAAKRQRQSLLFDNFHLKDNDQYRTMNEFMVRAQTRSVIVHRNNSLDTLVCDVRDCFEDPAGVKRGYTVDEHGKRIKLCFDRRGSSQATLAHLQPSHVVHHLREAASFPQEQAALLKKLGYQAAETVLVEDLYAFEYSQHNLDRSVVAWKKLFKSLGVTASSRKIRGYLRKDVASRSRPSPHSKSVSNLNAVKQILEKEGPEFSWMIRRR